LLSRGDGVLGAPFRGGDRFPRLLRGTLELLLALTHACVGRGSRLLVRPLGLGFNEPLGLGAKPLGLLRQLLLRGGDALCRRHCPLLDVAETAVGAFHQRGLLLALLRQLVGA